jgi:hypothetical protein
MPDENPDEKYDGRCMQLIAQFPKLSDKNRIYILGVINGILAAIVMDQQSDLRSAECAPRSVSQC